MVVSRGMFVFVLLARLHYVMATIHLFLFVGYRATIASMYLLLHVSVHPSAIVYQVHIRCFKVRTSARFFNHGLFFRVDRQHTLRPNAIAPYFVNGMDTLAHPIVVHFMVSVVLVVKG